LLRVNRFGSAIVRESADECSMDSEGNRRQSPLQNGGKEGTVRTAGFLQTKACFRRQGPRAQKSLHQFRDKVIRVRAAAAVAASEHLASPPKTREE